MITVVGSSGGGCNTWLACGTFALLLGGIMALSKEVYAFGDVRKTASQPLGQQNAPSQKEESTQKE